MIQWLKDDFLQYLDEWEASADSRIELTKSDRNRLCLSRETLEGLRMTGKVISYTHNIVIVLTFFIVHSFVELTRYLRDKPGVQYFLSEKLCQDPLESFFGKQRMRGGYSDNPTVQTFLKGNRVLKDSGINGS